MNAAKLIPRKYRKPRNTYTLRHLRGDMYFIPRTPPYLYGVRVRGINTPRAKGTTEDTNDRALAEYKLQPTEKRMVRPDDRAAVIRGFEAIAQDAQKRHCEREEKNPTETEQTETRGRATGQGRRQSSDAAGVKVLSADRVRRPSAEVRRVFLVTLFRGRAAKTRTKPPNRNCQAAARTAKDRHGRTARTTGGTGVARPFAAIRRQAGRWEPTFATATAENADRNGRPAAGRRPRPGARDRARDRRRHRNRALRSEAAPRRTGRNSRSTYKKTEVRGKPCLTLDTMP